MSIKPSCEWTNKYKDNWKDAYERMMAWWNFEETDRPVVLNPVKKEESLVNERKTPIITPEEKAKLETDVETHISNAVYYNENHIFTAESAPRTGTYYASLLGMLAACAGCEIMYEPNTLNAWMIPTPDLYNRELPVFNPEQSPYAFTIEMISRYHEKFGKDIILGANPMLDPLTTLAMMRGVEDFCVDLYEQPENVLRWTKCLGDMYLNIVGGYRNVRSTVGRREEYNWTGAWAPGDMEALQCDVCSYLSPAMFRKFALEEAEREAEFMDYALWHLDGTGQFIHLPDICAVKKINAIQWVDEKFRNPVEFTHIWEKILQTGKGLLISAKLDEAVELTKRLGKKGLAFNLSDVTTPGEMEAALTLLRETA